jgi:uncharacterized coiled-coil DUF342 family protein
MRRTSFSLGDELKNSSKEKIRRLELEVESLREISRKQQESLDSQQATIDEQNAEIQELNDESDELADQNDFLVTRVAELEEGLEEKEIDDNVAQIVDDNKADREEDAGDHYALIGKYEKEMKEKGVNIFKKPSPLPSPEQFPSLEKMINNDLIELVFS